MVNLLTNVLTSLVRIQLILRLLVHDESPLLLLPRIFVFVFRQFDCHVFGMHLFDLSYWSSLNFLDVHVNVSVKFGEFGALFLQIFFQLLSLVPLLSSEDSNYACVDTSDDVPQLLEALFTFPFCSFSD